MSHNHLQDACLRACREEIAPMVEALDLDDDVVQVVSAAVSKALVLGAKLAAVEMNARLIETGVQFDIEEIDLAP